MKNIFLITIIFILSTVKINAQTIPHPTISTLKISYKAVPQATTNAGVMCMPQATINIKPSVDVTKIYFKILDKITNAVIYQVNYSLTSGTITNNEGRKLFENNNGVIFISNGQAMNLKPYIYQVQTEDSQNNLSTIYSSTQ